MGVGRDLESRRFDTKLSRELRNSEFCFSLLLSTDCRA